VSEVNLKPLGVFSYEKRKEFTKFYLEIIGIVGSIFAAIYPKTSTLLTLAYFIVFGFLNYLFLELQEKGFRMVESRSFKLAAFLVSTFFAFLFGGIFFAIFLLATERNLIMILLEWIVYVLLGTVAFITTNSFAPPIQQVVNNCNAARGKITRRT